MAPKRVRLHIWCEDRGHEQFLRTLFKKHYGLDGQRDITWHVAAAGKGAASQWVASQYQTALKLFRAAKHQTNLGFLVVVDGDNQGVHQRKQELLGSPTENREPQRLPIQ